MALKAPAHPVINTLGLPPCLLHTMVTIGLMTPVEAVSIAKTYVLAINALEFVGTLLDDGDLDGHYDLRTGKHYES